MPRMFRIGINSVFAIMGLFAAAPISGSSLVWMRDLNLPADLSMASMPSWSNGALLIVESDASPAPVIKAFNDQGTLVAAFTLTLPGSPRVTKVYSVARSPRGRIGACGLSVTADGRHAPFLAQFSTDGSNLQITATAPYQPMWVTFVPDDTLWSMGDILVKGKEDPSLGGSYDLAKHFDAGGKQLGSALPRLSLSSFSQLAGVAWMVSSMDTIGWYSGEGSSGAEYYELSSSGSLVKYPGVPTSDHLERPIGLAMLDDGATLLSTVNRTRKTSLLYKLDRQTRQWVAIPLLPILQGKGNAGWLLGEDGGRLVFYSGTHLGFCQVAN